MGDVVKSESAGGLALPEVKLVGLPERFQPRNLTELMAWSKLVGGSGLAPKGMNEAGIVLAVQMGAELGITPTQALQNIAVINGRPSIFGDLGLALFRRDARYTSFEERDPAEALAKGAGWCKIVMKDGTTVERSFSIEDAKRAQLYGKQGPWTQYTGRMLMFRARWWAMRDAAPEVFKGCAGREEQEDIPRDVTPEARIRRPESNEPDPAAITPELVGKFVGEKSKPSAAQVAPAPVAPAPAQPAPPVTAPDRSKLQKVLVHDVVKKTASGKVWFEIQVETSGGARLQPTTFSESSYDVARGLVGCFAMIETAEKVRGDKTYLNLIHIEADGGEAPPSDEPGSNG